MNATIFYGSSRKKAKLALPVDGSEDELGFSDEENEQLATLTQKIELNDEKCLFKWFLLSNEMHS